MGVLTSQPRFATPAVDLLATATLWLDSAQSVVSNDFLGNLGTGGSVLNARLGAVGSDPTGAEPRFLQWEGTNYIWFPGVTGNDLTCPGFTIPSTEGQLSVPFTDGALTITQADIDALTAGSTSFVASTGQTVTLNRSTGTGRKLAVVTRSIWMFDGFNDYMLVDDNDLLDFAESDSFTVFIAMRRWGGVGAVEAFVAKANSGNAGYRLWRNNDNDRPQFTIDDGTTFSERLAAAPGPTAGATTALFGIRDTVNDIVNCRWLPTHTETGTDNTTGTLSNATALSIGRTPGNSQFAGMEMLGVAIWRRVLTAAEMDTITSYYGCVSE
jgi:hypothetical protein